MICVNCDGTGTIKVVNIETGEESYPICSDCNGSGSKKPAEKK